MSQRFRVMGPDSIDEETIYRRLACPRTVPWSFVAPHELQARRNHGQSLNRLNERGGLDPRELVAMVEGRALFPMALLAPSIVRLKELLAAHADDEVD